MAKMRTIEPKTDEMGHDCCEVAMPSKGDKKEPKKFYPRVEFNHDFFPEMKKWEVGKEYEVTLMLKMDEQSISRFQNNSGFEIHGIEVDDTTDETDSDEEE